MTQENAVNEAVDTKPDLSTRAPSEALVERLKAAQQQLDDTPFQGAPPLLTDHPLSHIITWFFEQTGYPAPDKWVAGSTSIVIGGPVEYRNIANNEFRRILGLAEISGRVSSFDMRFLLNRDPGTAEWLQTLQSYVIPFILEHSLLEITAADFLNVQSEAVDE